MKDKSLISSPGKESAYLRPPLVYLTVTVRFSVDGQFMPRSIEWQAGRVYPIDAVIAKRKAASLKGGGAGICYDCRIANRQIKLFFVRGRWFMEQD